MSLVSAISESGNSQQSVTEASNQKEYRTRIVTTANKSTLKLEEAQAKMFDKSIRSMGIRKVCRYQ